MNAGVSKPERTVMRTNNDHQDFSTTNPSHYRDDQKIQKKNVVLANIDFLPTTTKTATTAPPHHRTTAPPIIVELPTALVQQQQQQQQQPPSRMRTLVNGNEDEGTTGKTVAVVSSSKSP
jgi:hypothetical protein